MGYHRDGSYSAVGGHSLGHFMSPGANRGRAEARSRMYEESVRRLRDAAWRNVDNHSVIRTYGYPFGGHDASKRMDLEHAWQLLKCTWPTRGREDEDILSEARRRFFAHCKRDNPELFRSTFLAKQDSWIAELYEHHAAELVPLLADYWPFGCAEGLHFHHAYRLLTEHPHDFDPTHRTDAAERMLRGGIRSLGRAKKLAALAGRPLKQREILRCFAPRIRSIRALHRREAVADQIVLAYEAAGEFGHQNALRLVSRYITHAAHCAGRSATSIAEVDEIERRSGRKMPFAYREAAADRFLVALKDKIDRM